MKIKRLCLIVMWCIVLTIFATILFAQSQNNLGKFIGRVEWLEQIQTNGKKTTISHSGSCIAVDIGSHSAANLRLLITASHVVDGTKYVIIQIQGKTFVANVIERDEEQDIAYLEAPSSVGNLQATPCNTLSYELGDKVYTAIGFSHEKLLFVNGKVGKFNQYKICSKNSDGSVKKNHYVTGMIFTNACVPGMSGGGVFDSKGHLKGLLVASDDKTSVFIPWGRAVGKKPPNKL